MAVRIEKIICTVLDEAHTAVCSAVEPLCDRHTDACPLGLLGKKHD